jgi:hypothetical protein
MITSTRAARIYTEAERAEWTVLKHKVFHQSADRATGTVRRADGPQLANARVEAKVEAVAQG